MVSAARLRWEPFFQADRTVRSISAIVGWNFPVLSTADSGFENVLSRRVIPPVLLRTERACTLCLAVYKHASPQQGRLQRRRSL